MAYISPGAREGQERGKGIPFQDVERVMRHYGIDEETARYWLTIHPVDILLPERGTGLSIGVEPLESCPCLALLLSGLILGCAAGVALAGRGK
jgi:hypothetical protein